MPGRGKTEDEGDPTLTFRPDALEDDAATAVFGDLPEAEQTVLRCGTYVGDYQLLYPIADGGMGAVWCARPRKRVAGGPRSVVIKTILPQLAAEPHLQALFLDELGIASRIHHPNVVEIRETGESAGILFAVMDDVDGGSLSAFQKWVVSNQKPARVPDMLACHLVAQAARGLHAAHELRGEGGALLGVVHRDTSPQNILIDATGRALVIDFGLAKSVARLAEPTRSASMRGKLRYMAPEQAAGKPIDRRVDVWALGATLHQLLTGTTPYDGPNDMIVLHALVTGQALLPLPPYVRPEIAGVLRRCLAHDPEARFATAGDLADELDRVVSISDTPRPRADHADLIDGFVRSGRVRREESFDRALQSLQRRKTIPDLGEVGASIAVAPEESGPAPVVLDRHPGAEPDVLEGANLTDPAPPSRGAPPPPTSVEAQAVSARGSRDALTMKPSRRRSHSPTPPKESLWKTLVAFVVFLVAIVVAVKLSRGPERATAPPTPIAAASSSVPTVVATTAPAAAAAPPPVSPLASAETTTSPTTAPSASHGKAVHFHPGKPPKPARPAPTPAKTAEAPSKPASTLDTVLDQRK